MCVYVCVRERKRERERERERKRERDREREREIPRFIILVFLILIFIGATSIFVSNIFDSVTLCTSSLLPVSDFIVTLSTLNFKSVHIINFTFIKRA